MLPDKLTDTSLNDRKSSSPSQREISPMSSPELEVEVEVDSPLTSAAPSPSAIVEVTTRSNPSPYQKRSKNSESFSVNALLRPDMPRNRNKPEHNHTSSYHPAFAETISVTRSLLYPNLPLSDMLKEGKEILTNSVAVLPRRPPHNFSSIPHNVGLYNMHLQQQHQHQNTPSPSTTPIPATTTMTMMSVKDNVDFLDANRNFLAGSLYLSLGAVQAAAAAAITHPTSTGNTGTCFQCIY